MVYVRRKNTIGRNSPQVILWKEAFRVRLLELVLNQHQTTEQNTFTRGQFRICLNMWKLRVTFSCCSCLKTWEKNATHNFSRLMTSWLLCTKLLDLLPLLWFRFWVYLVVFVFLPWAVSTVSCSASIHRLHTFSESQCAKRTNVGPTVTFTSALFWFPPAAQG